MRGLYYDLENDISETADVAGAHPDVVRTLMKYIEQARADLGDAMTNRKGRNLRPTGQLPEGVSPLPDRVAVPQGRSGRGATGWID